MDIDNLIKEAEVLKDMDYESPKIAIWKKKAGTFVRTTYGEDYKDILDSSLQFPKMIRGNAHGQQMHTDAMGRAVEFLEGIKNEPIQQPENHNTTGAYHIRNLHKEISSKCSSLFEKEEYPEAVEKGFKVVRDKLRSLTSFETGSDAFGKGKLYIKGAAATHVEEDFNKGVQFLTMAIDRFRNEKAHTSDGNINEPQKAYEYLALCSLAMHHLDNAEIRQ